MTDIDTSPAARRAITLADLRRANEQRQALWCPNPRQQPDLSFRAMELGGEVGEALNVAKKLVREANGWRGSRATTGDLGEELADVVICADLMAMAAGINLAAAVVEKFNATSAKIGLPVTLAAEKEAAGKEPTWHAGYRACVETVLSYRAHYDWGPKATAQDGAEIAMQSIKDCVVRSMERQGVAPGDQDATLATVRASLLAAEQERDQAIAMAEGASELAKADEAEITAWRTRALRLEGERDAAIARAEEAERDRDSADAGAEALEAKIATLCKLGRTCSCSYDALDRVCMYHSPQLTAAVARAEKAESGRDVARSQQRMLKTALIRVLTEHEAEKEAILARADKAEAQVERMRAALRLVLDRAANGELGTSKVQDIIRIARAALAEQEAGDA